MKKTLLLCLAVAACFGSAMADTKTPTIYEDGCFQRFSKDGRYLVSQANGILGVYDLVEGTKVEYGDGDMESYTRGHGNFMTDDASIILASSSFYGPASYLENGEWHALDVPNEDMNNSSNGITPDGSRIVGSVGMNEITFEDGVLMMAPAYWDRNADGTYGECHILPHPEKDFFDEVPQYVTAIVVSNDGKTIVGQMQFGNGSMVVPVVYTVDDKGEWSYSLPTKDLFNPNKLEPVEQPTDYPVGPNYMDYLTEEEYAAYEQAVNDYYNSENPGATPYPTLEEFMSEENRLAYEAAMTKYYEEYAEWQEKYEKYDEYLTAVLMDSPNFTFNNMYISTDNTEFIQTIEFENPNATSWFDSTLFEPAVINIATGEMTKIETPEKCQVSGVADNGVIFGYNGQSSTPMRGYIIQNGEVQDIEEYLTSINPSFGEWIKENMTHPVIVDYDENWDPITEECTFTGMPVSTPDISKLAFWNNSPWTWENTCEGVVFDFSKAPTGINTIAAAKGNLKFVNGTLQVPAGFVSVDIYNLSGACVKAVNKPAGAVKLDLSNGAYIAKGTRADGSVCVLKIAK